MLSQQYRNRKPYISGTCDCNRFIHGKFLS
jgi:hypothetical protein